MIHHAGWFDDKLQELYRLKIGQMFETQVSGITDVFRGKVRPNF